MALFEPLQQRSLRLRNRIVVSPMCQYSLADGAPGDWHLVHLGSRATGGASLVITEAAAVSAEGRISPMDAGIWNDRQAQAWARITAFVRSQGAAPGMQLAHAGRKASTAEPWKGGKAVASADGGWEPVAPSALAFSADYPFPRALDEAGIAGVIAEFRAGAVRALGCGIRTDRTACGAWLSAAPVPVAVVEPPRGPMGWQFRQSHPSGARSAGRFARSLAGAVSAVAAHLRHRLGGRWLGHRAERGVGARTGRPRAWIWSTCPAEASCPG